MSEKILLGTYSRDLSEKLVFVIGTLPGLETSASKMPSHHPCAFSRTLRYSVCCSSEMDRLEMHRNATVAVCRTTPRTFVLTATLGHQWINPGNAFNLIRTNAEKSPAIFLPLASSPCECFSAVAHPPQHPKTNTYEKQDQVAGGLYPDQAPEPTGSRDRAYAAAAAD